MAVFVYLYFCVALCTVLFFFLIRASRCRRLRLPPGNLGLPFIGETLQLISAYKTENPEPFIDERVSRFGPIFTTHVFGEPTVFSADPETNRFILQNEGKLFECSYPASISNLLGRHSLLLMKGSLHKRMHSLTMSFANSSIIRDHLLVDIDRLIRLNLDSWTGRVFLMEEAKKVRPMELNFNVTKALIPPLLYSSESVVLNSFKLFIPLFFFFFFFLSSESVVSPFTYFI
jgi:cytochrome P450 family 90 subfamily A polypeptide 1